MPGSGGPGATNGASDASNEGMSMEAIIAAAKAKAQAIMERRTNSSAPAKSISGAPGPAGQGSGGGTGAVPGKMPEVKGSTRKRVPLPITDHPNVDFAALVNGVGGATLRSIRERSGADIAIVGKGVVEGAPFVLIGADTDAQVSAAEAILKDMLSDIRLLRAHIRQGPLQSGVATPSALAQPGTNASGRASAAGEDDSMPVSLYDETVTEEFRKNGANRAVLGSKRYGLAAEKTKELKVPDNDAGRIIGRGGETIQSLQASTGARIQVAKECRPGSPLRRVTLSGSEPQIARAEAEIMALVQQSADSSGAANAGGVASGSTTSKTIEIAQNQVGTLIGHRGETVKMIQSLTGCMVTAQRDNTGSMATPMRTVVLSGTPEQIKNAEIEIEKVLKAAVPTRPTVMRPGGPTPPVQGRPPPFFPGYRPPPPGFPSFYPPPGLAQQYGGYPGYPPQQPYGYASGNAYPHQMQYQQQRTQQPMPPVGTPPTSAPPPPNPPPVPPPPPTGEPPAKRQRL